MWGIASLELGLAYLLCILAALLCVVYGLVKWNDTGPLTEDLSDPDKLAHRAGIWNSQALGGTPLTGDGITMKIILALIYLLVVFYLGYKGWRETRQASDYMLAGRRMNPFVMAMSYGATFISTSAHHRLRRGGGHVRAAPFVADLFKTSSWASSSPWCFSANAPAAWGCRWMPTPFPSFWAGATRAGSCRVFPVW